jgi:hypothetical protein
MVTVPLGLLLAGCGGGHRAGFFHEQAAARPERTTDHPVAVRESPDSDRSVSRSDGGIAPRHEQRANGTIAAASRYDITLDELRRHLQDHTAVIIHARPPDVSRAPRPFALSSITFNTGGASCVVGVLPRNGAENMDTNDISVYPQMRTCLLLACGLLGLVC